MSRSRLLKIALISEGTALALAITLGYLFGIDIRLSSSSIIRDLTAGSLAALPPIALFAASLSERAGSLPGIGSLRRTMLNEVRSLFSRARFPDIIVISACAGIAEEALFRGVLQVRFGIVIASLVFGLAHFVTPAYMVAATIMGLYMGMIFESSGSLLVPVQTHFLYDLAALIYLKGMKPAASD